MVNPQLKDNKSYIFILSYLDTKFEISLYTALTEKKHSYYNVVFWETKTFYKIDASIFTQLIVKKNKNN